MKSILLFSFLFLISFFGINQRPEIPKKPSPPKLVNNFSKEFPNFISVSETQALENKLENFSRETSNQIVIIIIDDLAGYEPWDFATELGEQWQVGQEKEDNGIVILIKPTGEQGERKTHIAVGRGLEGAIPDLTANKIVENELIPNFKNGDFYKGLDDATSILMKLAKGEYNHKDYDEQNEDWITYLLFVIFGIAVILIIVSKFRGGGRGGFTYGSRGFFSGGSSGGGSSSFGGFGGGSFGGGGSGGNW